MHVKPFLGISDVEKTSARCKCCPSVFYISLLMVGPHGGQESGLVGGSIASFYQRFISPTTSKPQFCFSHFTDVSTAKNVNCHTTLFTQSIIAVAVAEGSRQSSVNKAIIFMRCTHPFLLMMMACFAKLSHKFKLPVTF
jgi:hypothetical protein